MRIHMPSLHRNDNPNEHSEADGAPQKPVHAAVEHYSPDYVPPPPDWPTIKLRLEVKDLAHTGAKLFFQHVNAAEALSEAVQNVFKWLYTVRSCPRQ